MITVIDINEAAPALYEVDDRRQLLGPLDRTLDLEDPVTLFENTLRLSERRPAHSALLNSQTLEPQH